MPPSVDLSGADSDEDENYDEPEVPEYLLAERRQRGQQRPGVGRGRPTGGRGGGNRSAYQAALDRERYGSGARAPQSSFGNTGNTASSGNTGNSGNRSQGGNRDRNRQGGRPPQGSRPMDRGPRQQDRPMMEPRSSSSSEPWSEVPPELEEMLRAELARKQPLPMSDTPVVSSSYESAAEPVTETAPAKPARRARTTTTKRSTATGQAPEAAAEAPQAPAEAPTTAKAPAKRTTKPRTTKASAASATAADKSTAPAADAAAPAEAKKPTRRRTTKAAPPAEES
jgi:ribonuclease E